MSYHQEFSLPLGEWVEVSVQVLRAIPTGRRLFNQALNGAKHILEIVLCRLYLNKQHTVVLAISVLYGLQNPASRAS